MVFIIYYVKQKSAVKIPKKATVISDSSFFYALRAGLKKAFHKIYVTICGNDFLNTL